MTSNLPLKRKQETQKQLGHPPTTKEPSQNVARTTTQAKKYKFLHSCLKKCCTNPNYKSEDVGIYLIGLDRKKTDLDVSSVYNQDDNITLDNIDSEINVPCLSNDGNVLVCDESVKHWIVKYTTTDVALLKEDGSVVPGRHVIEVEKSNHEEEMVIKILTYDHYGCSRLEMWEMDPSATKIEDKRKLLYSNDGEDWRYHWKTTKYNGP